MIEFPLITSTKGSLTVFEFRDLPFDPERAYLLHDMPAGAERGGHAHKELTQAIVCAYGGFYLDLTTRDGNRERHYLKYPWQSVVIPPGTWRELSNFEEDTVALVFADRPYEEEDYIRDFDEFMALKVVKDKMDAAAEAAEKAFALEEKIARGEATWADGTGFIK